MNNKVSEKVIWEDSIATDSDITPNEPQIQSQPQMMFCYKCNNVIPNNSIYCPYCQTKLYTECPKCGAKYSSQYPVCNQCGTNRQEYLQWQRKEQERKEAIERENRRQREILEHKRLEEEHRKRLEEEEKEQQKRLKEYERQTSEKKQKEAYLKKNEEIKNTEEYKTTFSLLKEALDAYDKKFSRIAKITIITYIVGFILIGYCCMNDIEVMDMEALSFGYVLLGIPICAVFLSYIGRQNKEKNFLLQYISSKSNYHKELVTTELIQMVSYQGILYLSECCIIAYRKKKGLYINYSWHKLRH